MSQLGHFVTADKMKKEKDLSQEKTNQKSGICLFFFLFSSDLCLGPFGPKLSHGVPRVSDLPCFAFCVFKSLIFCKKYW